MTFFFPAAKQFSGFSPSSKLSAKTTGAAVILAEQLFQAQDPCNCPDGSNETSIGRDGGEALETSVCGEAGVGSSEG